MARLMEEMVKCDNKIQILVGDELKQDQFEFFYNSVKILFDSALQDSLYNMKTDKTKVIEETVIPEMIAFKSIMRIRDI